MSSNLFPSLSVAVDEEKLSISDLFYALHDLHHLTECMVFHMAEMDFGTGEERNHELDRAYALAKIVSGQVAMLAVLAEPLDRPGFLKRAAE